MLFATSLISELAPVSEQFGSMEAVLPTTRLFLRLITEAIVHPLLESPPALAAGDIFNAIVLL